MCYIFESPRSLPFTFATYSCLDAFLSFSVIFAAVSHISLSSCFFICETIVAWAITAIAAAYRSPAIEAINTIHRWCIARTSVLV